MIDALKRKAMEGRLDRPNRGRLVAQTALDHLGGIDIVVNVLGGSEAPAGGFAALDDEAWRKEIDLNVIVESIARRSVSASLGERGRNRFQACSSTTRTSLRRDPVGHLDEGVNVALV